MRKTIVNRQHRLNPSIKDCRLRVTSDWTASPANAFELHSKSKRTILRLPDELLLRIYGLTRFIPTAICLALTCKRLCSLYLDILRSRSAEFENHLWNSTNGFWKYTLISNLIRGWVPKHSIRFCWCCWLFRPYGETSKAFWRVKISALTATAVPSRSCLGLHTLRAEVAAPILGISHILFDWENKAGIWQHNSNCDILLQYQNNWEVRFWLGEQGIAGVNTSLEKDKRIRCPSCVLMGNRLRLQESSMKIAWPKGPPGLSKVLEDTLERRAKMQGYQWDRRLGVYVMTMPKLSLTGSYRERQRKKQRRQES